jgi:hypothetical protein
MMPRNVLVRARGQAPMLAVLVVIVAAVAYLLIDPDRWRKGVGVIATALLLAGLLRAVLPTPMAGLLVVRGRKFDTLCYLVLGAAILIVDIRLPH